MKLILTVLLFIVSSSIALRGRIIGGQVARAGQFSFSAAIYITFPDRTTFCAGALLTNQWIITAGHCVDGATLFTIYLGTINIRTIDSTAVKVATDRYVLHPDFDPDTFQNDIGLVEVRTPITFTNYIKPIHFLPNSDLPANVGGTMTMGWGQTSDEQPGLSDELNFIYTIPLSNEECRNYYGDQITDQMICIGGRFNEGTCRGDSGSPLMRFNHHFTTHEGVSSFISSNGCESTDPSGYTRTYPYVKWIRNITNFGN